MSKSDALLSHPSTSIYISTTWVCFLLLLLSPEVVTGGEIVSHLPGFDGELPFKLETGYINVDEIELFYYFVESEGNSEVDPLFLWLTGGPGCTAFSGLIYEVGPMEYDISNYTGGGLPKLRYYPYGRTQVSSMLFLDQPVGTGFSYSRTAGGWHTSDSLSVEQSYQFLRKWLKEHPQYQSLPFFVGGDSYAGLIVPLIAKRIAQGNRDEKKLNINLKGYLVGSPLTDYIIDKNSKVIYAHKMGLISDEIYENARRNCNENYAVVDPSNEACLLAIRDVEKCTQDVSDRDILKPKCIDGLQIRQADEFWSGNEQFGLSLHTKAEPLYCIEFSLTHNNIWANDDGVQEALHVRKGVVGTWERCNTTLSYIKDIQSVVHIHKELSLLGLRALVESGDHDFTIPYVGTLQWIKSLNLTLTDKWRSWYVNNQVAGFTTTYSSDHEYHITFATIKGAGHPAPEYYRRECYYLFQRWLQHQPI